VVGALPENATMTDPQSTREERPVVDGLIALVVVGLAVGLILGVMAFAGARMVGLSGGSGGGGVSSAQDRMSIPPIEETDGPTGPAITLHTESPDDERDEASPTPEETEEPTEEATEDESDVEEGNISLSAGQTRVSNFGRIDLTGVYPGGEGMVLQIQRLESGDWRDFPATAAVRGETFSTYVQTGIQGVNTFRVVDQASNVISNEVRITVE
jgi:NACalpha-BTF3-like transcription factor